MCQTNTDSVFKLLGVNSEDGTFSAEAPLAES